MTQRSLVVSIAILGTSHTALLKERHDAIIRATAVILHADYRRTVKAREDYGRFI